MVVLTIMAAVLLAFGTIVALYSPWMQETVRQKLVEKMNSQDGVTMTLDRFRLGFPLKLTLDGLSLAQDGDTIVAAGELTASVSLWKLIEGTAKVSEIGLKDGRFRLGTPDSAMYMTIAGRDLALGSVEVGLNDMSIDIESGRLDGLNVAMAIQPDTASSPKADAEQTQMSIRLGRMELVDLNYSMKLLPTIDSLGATIAKGMINDGLIDLKQQIVDIKKLSGTGLSASYIAADSATIASTPMVETASDTTATQPWTVKIQTIDFSKSKALYTTRGVVPQPGLDFAYIAVDSLNLAVKDFYNQATTLRLPLTLSGRERCGVELNADGEFAMDSLAMYLNDLSVNTSTTSLDVNMTMGVGDLTSDPTLPLKLDVTGGVGVADLRMMFPAFLPYLSTLPANDQIDVTVGLNGTPAHLDIERLKLIVNGCVTINGDGYIGNLTDADRLTGDIHLAGNVINLNRIKNSVLGKDAAKDINIPRMALAGRVKMQDGTIDGRVNVKTGGGSIALDGKWNSKRENYSASLSVKDFPIETIMPNIGVADVTATLKAKGHGYNPFATTMKADAELDVMSARYADYTYRDIYLTANVADGKGRVAMHSDNPDTKVQLLAEGTLAPQPFDWTIVADGDAIDLHALKFSELDSELTFNLSGRAQINTDNNTIDGELTLNELKMTQPTKNIRISDVRAMFASNDSLTELTVRNGDMTARFVSASSLDSLMAHVAQTTAELDRQIAAQTFEIEKLQNVMPQFCFTASAGRNNAINDVLAGSKMSFKKMNLTAANDSTVNFDAQVLGFASNTTRLDTIAVGLNQLGELLVLKATVDNRPGTFDEWAHVKLDGALSRNELGLRFKQNNISGKEGFNIGMKASLVDSVAKIHFTPVNQTIGYQVWTVNENNFISLDMPTKHVDADLTMTGGSSRLSILTEHVEGSHDQEDLKISVTDIHLADWISINPFAPPVKGDLNADVTLRPVDNSLNGFGEVSLDNFYYGKERVANVKVDFDVTTKPGGTLYAKSDVFIDGAKTMTLAGALNDSTLTSPYNLDFSMIRFPLATVNPFLPPRMAKLRGVLNGTMQISGDNAAPIFNGYLDFDSTAIMLNLTGTEYGFSEERIPVVDNLVSFDRFTIKGVNDKPLYIDGTVDISSLTSPMIDLTLKADGMQLVDTNRARKGADVYGKAFISLDSRVHGNMSLLFVNADLRIMPPTNVTYVISDAANAIASQSTGDMVKFVNFTDTTAVMMADSLTQSSMAMILDASLTIENGTTIGVNLSSDGKNRAQIEADGTLNYTMSPVVDGRMTGRLNINNGYVRYSPPLMSEKNFTFDNNSYVAFNGDMINPTLNVHAIDVIKANVTQSGQDSRLVNFDVILNVTGTLDRLDVSFNLETNDDMTVANELQSMSADQRANQAMNMLLYGIYTGPGTKGDASITGNALYSFLESQLNSWAANNIKGVDISFGINQYDRTVDGSSSQTTSYSYQVSKSLFNDRFKIVIGGNYSTDANADENFSQNLINDISFDYFLNKGHTMYVRIFRHTGYESILEGEITQTGVGFVYRRKLNHLGDMFKFLKRKSRKNENVENK